MDVLNSSTSRRHWEWSALAGLETGVLGGMAMLLFLFTNSVLRGQPWWSYANLLGSAVYRSSALWRGFGRATCAGIALQILLSGVAGVLFGVCFARTRGRTMSLLLGMSSGIIWFSICHWMLFTRVAPLVPVYASQPATLLAYMILGLMLSQTSRRFGEYASEAPAMAAENADFRASGISDAYRGNRTAEIVPPHRLE